MNDLVAAALGLGATLPVVLLTQRWIHRHLQGLSLLITGKPEWAVILYAVFLFPGVLLHELSHWLMATFLFVRTGSFSLIPKLNKDGTIQLGAVEYYKSSSVGPIRETLIGGAPLIAGTAAVLLMGSFVFNLGEFSAAFRSGNVGAILIAFQNLLQTNDIFVWLYFFFAISNAMMPSPADRKAWPGFLLTVGVAALIVFLLDLEAAVLAGLSAPLTTVIGYISLAFGLTAAANLFFMLIIALVEIAISRLRGIRVDYE